MKVLKYRVFSFHIYTLTYDNTTITYWVTEVFNDLKGDTNKYAVSFPLLSEAERFYDLLVAQREVCRKQLQPFRAFIVNFEFQTKVRVDGGGG